MRLGSRGHRRHPRRHRGHPVSPASQGPPGPQGERGTAGLSGPVRRALVFLFALAVLLGALDLFWTAHQVDASKAAQRSQGQAVEQKLCTTFAKLAVLQPPAGDPSANPSRAYLQGQHAVLVELGTDLGCK